MADEKHGASVATEYTDGKSSTCTHARNRNVLAFGAPKRPVGRGEWGSHQRPLHAKKIEGFCCQLPQHPHSPCFVASTPSVAWLRRRRGELLLLSRTRRDAELRHHGRGVEVDPPLADLAVV